MKQENLELYVEIIEEFIMSYDSGSRQDIYEDVEWVHEDLSEEERSECIRECEDMFSSNDHNVRELIKEFLTNNKPNLIKTYSKDCLGSDLYDTRYFSYSEHSWNGIYHLRDLFDNELEFFEEFEIKNEDKEFLSERLKFLSNKDNYTYLEDSISVYKK